MDVELQERKTYPQNWAAYNRAQTTEKDQFLKLLSALCGNLQELPASSTGRKRIPMADALFGVVFKVYSTVSARRFMSDLRDAQEKGFISHAVHFNSVLNYLENSALTPILNEMIVESSLPLKSVETHFAADSSGFTASRYSRWIDHKYGAQKQKDWVKAHVMCGVKTNIITAVEIRGKNCGDAPMMPHLINTTADNFQMKEVSADKAYGSFKNYDAISGVGATPYIPFKENSRKEVILTHLKSELWGHKIRDEKTTKNVLWNKMYHLFRFHKEEFMQHYHRRSNVETVFSMIKTKFGGSVRSKTDTAMINEVLAKILCHNICVLIQETEELGINIQFE